jgi:ribosomal protein S27AE
MKDVRVDEEGRNLHCWKCGGTNFEQRRTFRSKAVLGVGALLTKKKLKCQNCGEYNDTGSARPSTVPTEVTL